MTCPRCLNRNGIYALAARLIEDAIRVSIASHEVERDDKPSQLGVALDWAVMCGQDVHEVAWGIAARIVEIKRGNEREAQSRRADAREYKRLAQYAHDNRCPVCGVPITNRASTCNRHRGQI